MLRRVALGAVLVGLISTACYNVSSYQTAEALKKGQMAAGAGIGYAIFPASKLASKDEASSESDDGDVTLPQVSLPYNDYFFRVGAGSGLEVGAKYSVPTGLSVDFKVQFLDAGVLDMAIDPAITFGSFIFMHMLGVDLPLLVSLRFSDTLGLYGGARVIYWRWMCTVEADCDSDIESAANSLAVGGFVGVTVDVPIESDLALFIRPEVHYYRLMFFGAGNQFNIIQPGLAVGLRFGGGVRRPRPLPAPAPAPQPAAPPPAPAPVQPQPGAPAAPPPPAGQSQPAAPPPPGGF